MKLNITSLSRLRGVHPDLVRVVLRCADDWKDKDTGFIVTQGVRTLEEQKLLVKKGASRTLRSRHLKAPNGYAHAVDLAVVLKGAVTWHFPLYDRLAKAMKAAARAEKVPLEWGGDWKTFKDGPHYQLPWKEYPGTKTGAKK
jgi:peptidoglycan L-alanyl-D-glutamate endopeptidase CwlK